MDRFPARHANAHYYYIMRGDIVDCTSMDAAVATQEGSSQGVPHKGCGLRRKRVWHAPEWFEELVQQALVHVPNLKLRQIPASLKAASADSRARVQHWIRDAGLTVDPSA
eukprot:6397408-Amphidinium_carterae.1